MRRTSRRNTALPYIIRKLFVWIMLLSLSAADGLSQQGVTVPPPVSGVVLDPSGAVIADAKVILRRRGDRSELVTTSDQRGDFRFARVPAGDYEVEVSKEGFKLTVIRLTADAKPHAALRVQLPIADVQEEITVGESSNQVSVNPNENLNVLKLERETLQNLPVLGNDVIGSLTRLIDAGSAGSGGATVIIDGLERPGKKLSAARIQEVRINQNPYSAEFARPGRGRIEVITRAGSTDYHGEMGFIFRDHRLDARNAFALTRPPEQRRIFEGNLTGPIGSGKTTSFLFNVEREEEDLQAIVFALTPGGIVSQNIDTPARETDFSLRLDHQLGKQTTLSLRYEFSTESTRNDGVGGFNLPEVGADSTGGEHEIYFTHRRIFSPRLVNEFTIRVDHETEATRSLQNDLPRLVVLDAFTGGGGQADRRATETQVQINEIVSWTKGKHFIRAGANIPGFTRHRLSDHSNFGGTFSFSTLTDYVENRPFLYSVNQGDGDLSFWQKELGFFVQDNIAMRPNLSFGLGLRYDWQNYLGDHNNFAPRVSFAYAPGKELRTVVRGGAGIFYDRTGSGVLGDRLLFDGRRLQQVILTDPGYPDPLASGGTLAAQPASIVRFAPDLRSPYTLQFSLGVERQINKSLTATASYINTRGVKLFRSRNLNAPPPPFYLEPPDATIGVLRQIESSAGLRGHALELVLRGRVGRFFNGTAQYNLGRAYNSTAGINSLPANSYDLTGEWSRAEFDERHRFHLIGTLEAGDWLRLGMTLSLTSGRPYNLTTGRDDNRDSLANDRPAGVSRNSLQGPGSAILDLRWSKEFPLQAKKEDGPTFSIGVDAFNVLNRTNYVGFVGNASSPFFGLPVAARPARRLQLSFGFEF